MQTVELMLREMQDMKSSIEGLKSSIDGVKSYTNEIAEATARLLHIAQIHEHRLTRLEEQK